MFWNAKNAAVPIGDTEMSYVSFGHGEKNLIILPGLSDGLTTVKGKAMLLAKPYELFFEAYTVFMFSRKNKLPENYSIREMAADQAKVLEALALNRVSVLGVSQGGMISQFLAIDYPELVEKLVIAVSAPYANEIVRECVSRWIDLVKKGNHKQLMIDTAEKSYSPKVLEKYRKIYPLIGAAGKASNFGRFITNANAILGFDARDDLEKITCPTLIIGGEEDKIVGIQASYEMNERITGSKLFVYAGLGHAAYEEAKDFNRRIFTFLEKL